MKNCPRCGRAIDDSFKFCPFDSTFLGSTCPTCGQQWEELYAFCPIDATRLTGPSRQAFARSAGETAGSEVDSVPHRWARTRLRYAAWTGLFLLLCGGLWGIAWPRTEANPAVRVVGIAASVVAIILLFYVVQVARRARREMKFRLRRVAVSLLLYGFSAWTLLSLRYSAAEILVVSVLFGLTPLYFRLFRVFSGCPVDPCAIMQFLWDRYRPLRSSLAADRAPASHKSLITFMLA